MDRDVWARIERDGTVTLGMTDPAQTRCGKIVSVRFKAAGRRVAVGQSLATIESAKWVGPFPAVLSGVIAANNEAGSRADVLVANQDPYGAGWLVRLEPAAWEAERARLLTGPVAAARYGARIDEQKVSCLRCAQEREGNRKDPDGEG